MPWRCLVITSFWWLSCDYVCALLLWGLLPLVVCKCLQVFSLSAQDVNFFHINFWVSIAKLLKDPSRLSSDCPKSNLFDPQDYLKRCRGGYQSELIHLLGIQLAPTMWLSGEPAIYISSCGRSGPKKGDDGTDFGRISIQSNGLIALELG